MANDNKKPKNDALEEALKEFEGSGGFDGSSRSSSSKASNEHENAFEEDFEELPTSGSNQNEQEDDDYIEYDEHSDSDGIDQDFDVMDDSDLENDEFEEHTEVDDKKNHKKQKSSKNFNDADGTSGVPVISKLKEPKNIVMLIIAICFILFLVLGGNNKAKKKKSNNIEDEIASEVSDFSNMQNDQPAIDESSTPKPTKQKKQVTPEVALQDIELPSLDIKMPEIKEEDADLIPKIPEPKMLDEEKSDKKTKDKIPDINIQEVNIRDKNEKSRKSEIIDVAPDVDIKKKKRDPIAKKDGEIQKSLITDFTAGAEFPLKQKNKKNAHDFIFMDTDLDIEKEDEKSVISATRIQNPENVISQGRIIDAVLETAVNSSISGQVRAIVTRDVYAEVGRNILVPKGTRLYGEYGAASTSSGGGAGSGANAGGRIVIKWSRIMRPDNVSATIDSYASDQFGRSGISGQVDSNYIGGITSSVLLSTIPLVTTIIANAITNTNPQTVTVGGAAGTTIIQDPINVATQAFTKSVGTVISDITKNAINTQPTITLDQGTRVKVLVNKDIKLPTYKPLTKASGSAFSE